MQSAFAEVLSGRPAQIASQALRDSGQRQRKAIRVKHTQAGNPRHGQAVAMPGTREGGTTGNRLNGIEHSEHREQQALEAKGTSFNKDSNIKVNGSEGRRGCGGVEGGFKGLHSASSHQLSIDWPAPSARSCRVPHPALPLLNSSRIPSALRFFYSFTLTQQKEEKKKERTIEKGKKKKAPPFPTCPTKSASTPRPCDFNRSSSSSSSLSPSLCPPPPPSPPSVT